MNIKAVRGMEGVKEAEVQVGDSDAQGSGRARTCECARKCWKASRPARFKDYHFIEIMCCPGGCIGGGGQPLPTSDGDQEEAD